MAVSRIDGRRIAMPRWHPTEGLMDAAVVATSEVGANGQPAAGAHEHFLRDDDVTPCGLRRDEVSVYRHLFLTNPDKGCPICASAWRDLLEQGPPD